MSELLKNTDEHFLRFAGFYADDLASLKAFQEVGELLESKLAFIKVWVLIRDRRF